MATMIATTKATHGIVITIDKYDIYQNPKNYDGNNESNNENDAKEMREQRTPNNINQEGSKKEKNNKTICAENAPAPSEVDECEPEAPLLPKDEKPKKPRKKSDSSYAQAVDYFFVKYKQCYGADYMFNGQRDGPAIKRMLGSYSLDVVRELIELYFEYEDDFIKNNGRNIALFASSSMVSKCLALKKQKEGYNKPSGGGLDW